MTTPTTVQVKIQLRGDTAANWASVNPVLLNNELGLETDTKKLKVGNGSTAWNSLAYFPSIVTGGTVLGNLEIGTTGTLTFEGSTADGFETTLGVINPTADRTINLPNQSGTVVVSGNATIVDADIAANAEIAVSKLADGAARQLLQTDAAGTGVEWTDNVDVPGTLDVTGAATFDAAVTIAGDLTVNGTTTNINTQNLVVEDKNIILADVASPTDVTADGGGITLKGATDKTITWSDTTDAWTSNQMLDVPAGSAATPSLIFGADVNSGIYSPGADQVAISTNGTGRLFIDSSGLVGIASGRLGIGTTSPGDLLTLNSTVGYPLATFNDSDVFRGQIGYTFDYGYFHVTSASTLGFRANGSERARIDSSGRLLVGTSTSISSAVGFTPAIQAVGASALAAISVGRYSNDGNGPTLILQKSRNATVGSQTIIADGDSIGRVDFEGSDGSVFRRGASIDASIDGSPSAGDLPTRLVFSTTADGASSPTERLRITNAGVLQVADAGNISVGTTTGTKIGTATTQKLGFYNATPVVQPTAVADATDAASVITQLNALLTRMRNLGLIAT
jgi:hypothetical protein